MPPTPLPALNLTLPRQPATRLPFRLAVSFTDAARLVEIGLAGQQLTWGGKSVRVEAARLPPGSEKLTIEAVLSGDLGGTVRLSGKPAFGATTRELYLAGLAYKLETGDTLVRSLDASLHDLIRGTIAARARWPLADKIATFQPRAEQAINRALPAPFRLRTLVNDIALMDIHLSEGAIGVKGSVEGKAEVLVDWSLAGCRRLSR